MAGELELITLYKVQFDRMKYSFVKGYNIRVRKYLEDGSVENTVEYVENQSSPSYIKIKVTLEYKRIGKWVMPDNMYYDIDRPVKVWLNGDMLSPMYWTFSEEYHEFRIITEDRLQETDILEIEYCADRMTFEYESKHSCEFLVTPVYHDNAYVSIGSHNILSAGGGYLELGL